MSICDVYVIFEDQSVWTAYNCGAYKVIIKIDLPSTYTTGLRYQIHWASERYKQKVLENFIKENKFEFKSKGLCCILTHFSV